VPILSPAGGEFHAIAVRGQQVAMATVNSNSGNIFLNYQGILSATYLAEAWQRNVAADLVGRKFFKYAGT
jgi:hypothetical protein